MKSPKSKSGQLRGSSVQRELERLFTKVETADSEAELCHGHNVYAEHPYSEEHRRKCVKEHRLDDAQEELRDYIDRHPALTSG